MPEVNRTTEEAIENAGTRVLSHLDSGAHILNQKEVEDFHAEVLADDPNAPDGRFYSGPYTAPDDQRNSWTFEQDAGAETPVGKASQPGQPGQPTPQHKPKQQHID